MDEQAIVTNTTLIIICTFILTSRANHLEEDLKAYFNVLSSYMEEKVDFKEFRQELEERRMKGITLDCKFTLLLYNQAYFQQK